MILTQQPLTVYFYHEYEHEWPIYPICVGLRKCSTRVCLYVNAYFGHLVFNLFTPTRKGFAALPLFTLEIWQM